MTNPTLSPVQAVRIVALILEQFHPGNTSENTRENNPFVNKSIKIVLVWRVRRRTVVSCS